MTWSARPDPQDRSSHNKLRPSTLRPGVTGSESPVDEDVGLVSIHQVERMAQGAHCRLRLTDGTERAAWVPKDALNGSGGGYRNKTVPMPTDGGPAFGHLAAEIIEWFGHEANRPRAATPGRTPRELKQPPPPKKLPPLPASEAPTRKMARTEFKEAVRADAQRHLVEQVTYPLETHDDLELEHMGFDPPTVPLAQEAQMVGIQDPTLSGTMAVPSSSHDEPTNPMVQIFMASVLVTAFLAGLALLVLAMAV